MRKTATVAFALAVTVVATAATQMHAVNDAEAGVAAPLGAPWPSGVYVRSDHPSIDQAWGTWRGSPIATTTDYLPSETWQTLEYPTSWASQWSAVPTIHVSYSVPAWPQTGGTLALAASGAYNRHYQLMAETLVAGGQGAATLRYGWEFNGSWMPWHAKTATDAANYAEAWRQFATTVRSVPGAHFTFDWAISNNAPVTYALALAYPGDHFVDYIGDDVYDTDYARSGDNSPSQRWQDLLAAGGDGLTWQAGFAALHHKPISVPEWAESDRLNNGVQVGGQDDPTFISNMYAWFAGHNVGYENYFAVDTPLTSYYHDLRDGRFARSALTYQSLFSFGHPSP